MFQWRQRPCVGHEDDESQGAQPQTRHSSLLLSIDRTDKRTLERYIDLAPGGVSNLKHLM